MKHLVLVIAISAATAFAAEKSFTASNGKTYKYLIEMPESDKPAPLAIVIGGGKGDDGPASRAMKKLGEPLRKRGYITASPISLTGTSFFDEKGAKQVLYLINHLYSKSEIEYGKVLIGGLSNGGISAYVIAQSRPSKYSGVIMTPGVTRGLTSNTDLKGLPIYLRIGAKDNLRWGDFYDPIVKQLKAANADLDSKLLPEAGHVIPLDWNDIDKWLASLTARP